jgi:thiol-disulfide isomerase/thioredoxin
MKRASLALIATAALAAGLTACGDSEPTDRPAAADTTPAATPSAAATTTAPVAKPRSALARNAADANRLVGDGREDLEARLASLKGHPVVVNQWASWCGPCRFEFPFFAAAVKKHGASVAFVGVDYMDSRDAAERFLDEQPPGFPSVYDGDGKASRAIGGGRVMPTTLFFDRTGRERHKKLGGYADAAALDADIRRYALASAR